MCVCVGVCVCTLRGLVIVSPFVYLSVKISYLFISLLNLLNCAISRSKWKAILTFYDRVVIVTNIILLFVTDTITSINTQATVLQ